VHDLVDFVSMEGARAGENAAAYIRGAMQKERDFYRVSEGRGVRGLVPQLIRKDGDAQGDEPDAEQLELQFRPSARIANCAIRIRRGDQTLKTFRRQIVTPGEICKVQVNRRDIQGDIMVEIDE
jgi:hypothetical protein